MKEIDSKKIRSIVTWHQMDEDVTSLTCEEERRGDAAIDNKGESGMK